MSVNKIIENIVIWTFNDALQNAAAPSLEYSGNELNYYTNAMRAKNSQGEREVAAVEYGKILSIIARTKGLDAVMRQVDSDAYVASAQDRSVFREILRAVEAIKERRGSHTFILEISRALQQPRGVTVSVS